MENNAMKFKQLCQIQEEINAANQSHPGVAIPRLHRILEDLPYLPSSIEAIELVIENLSALWRPNLHDLRKYLGSFFSSCSKERHAKLVHSINLMKKVHRVLFITPVPDFLYKEILQWTRAETQTLHCEQIEGRLAAFLMGCEEFRDSTTVIMEVRNLADKELFFQYKLQESILHTALGNWIKAKTALEDATKEVDTSQMHNATIDLQSGILLVKENRHKEALNLLIKACDAFNCDEDPRASYALKSLLLCKCYLNEDEQLNADFIPIYRSAIEDTIKEALGIFDRLKNIGTALDDYIKVNRHVPSLSDANLDLIIKGLIKIEEPSFKVEIAKIAHRLGLHYDRVVSRLSLMISEKRLEGKLKLAHVIIYIDPWTHARFAKGGPDLHNLPYMHDGLFAKATYCLLTDEEKCKYVLGVRDQMRTKSCWAFSFVDGLYAAACIQNHQNVLKGSEQELLDRMRRDEPPKPSNDDDDDRWRGQANNFHSVFAYVQKYGLAIDSDLPFKGRCLTVGNVKSVKKRNEHIDRIQKNKTRVFVKRMFNITTLDKVKEVLHIGPVMASVCSSQRFKKWRPEHGTFIPNKEEVGPSHSILLVGYGKDEDGCGYFIAKNSWGRDWGHRGYLKIAQNACWNWRFISGYYTGMLPKHLQRKSQSYAAGQT